MSWLCTRDFSSGFFKHQPLGHIIFLLMEEQSQQFHYTTPEIPSLRLIFSFLFYIVFFSFFFLFLILFLIHIPLVLFHANSWLCSFPFHGKTHWKWDEVRHEGNNYKYSNYMKNIHPFFYIEINLMGLPVILHTHILLSLYVFHLACLVIIIMYIYITRRKKTEGSFLSRLLGGVNNSI